MKKICVWLHCIAVEDVRVCALLLRGCSIFDLVQETIAHTLAIQVFREQLLLAEPSMPATGNGAAVRGLRRFRAPATSATKPECRLLLPFVAFLLYARVCQGSGQ
jgi:hypothetical protein